MLPEVGVVLDAGTGMFRVGRHLATSTLDIFLTHCHLDHVVGLTYLLDILSERPLDYVRVHAAASKIAAIEQHLFAEELFPVKPPFESVPLAAEVRVPGDGLLTHFPLAHPAGSVGYRLDWPGRSLAYVTDTTARADSDYIDLIRGVDVLVHECYFADGQEERAELTGHSCATPVALVARAAEAGILVLVHVDPLARDTDAIGLDRVRTVFPNTLMGVDGMEITF
jgi:ribonuclease BN (tRNA processing enzyme)